MSAPASSAAPQAQPTDGEPPADILLVDDRFENLMALEAMLEQPGLRLVSAQSGRDALMQLLARDFALILLDVQMPEMDGFETAQLIHTRKRSSHTPIIFLTAHDQSDAVVARGYSVGAVDFLFKPFVPQILRSKVAAFVELHRKTEQIKRQMERIREAEQRAAENRLAAQKQKWESDRLREEVEREKHRVAELQRLERQRRHSEERFRTLVTATSQIIWVTDANGEFTTPQPGWMRFTGQTFDELKGQGWLSAVHPEDRNHAGKAWQEAVAGRGLFEQDHRLRRHDGQFVPMTVRAAPVLEADGSIREWVGTHTDVSERQRAQDELQRAKDEAEAANIAKSQFLANMSHELRTPLNAIIMYSELLQEEAQDQKLNSFTADLEKIRAAGKHLLALVNGVLDLAKIEAGKIEVYPEPFDVAQMVREVAVMLQPLAQNRCNNLQVECPPDLGSMQSDLVKARQILFNLVSNACKFTEKGCVTLHVERQPSANSDWIIFRVSDTGIGMTPNQVEKLFQPFTQADPSTTRKYGGTGLGLAISKRFCEMLGGKIEVASEFGHGSVLTVRLPVLAPGVSAAEEKQ